LILNNSVLLRFRKSLVGLKRSGKHLGNISTEWCPSTIPWCRVRAKRGIGVCGVGSRDVILLRSVDGY